jgi:hypothetical protein
MNLEEVQKQLEINRGKRKELFLQLKLLSANTSTLCEFESELLIDILNKLPQEKTHTKDELFALGDNGIDFCRYAQMSKKPYLKEIIEFLKKEKMLHNYFLRACYDFGFGGLK